MKPESLPANAGDAPEAQRIDKWLWCARMVKTRSLGTKLAAAGGVRLTRDGSTQRIEKASALVKPGDSLAFMLGSRMRILEVIACGQRRGPATEAKLLYTDHSPPPAPKAKTAPSRDAGTGRPTKKDRRTMEKFRSQAEQG